jgi:hypothetical protein
VTVLEEGGLGYQGGSDDDVVQGTYHAMRVVELHCAGQSMEGWESGAIKEHGRTSMMMRLVDKLRDLNNHYWWREHCMYPQEIIDLNR